ncbi:MAG: hypothetical protein FVQ79_00085 [Planctomycetes bacterium]|nr:hypothetical protein [Planctomycetota bacterium]
MSKSYISLWVWCEECGLPYLVNDLSNKQAAKDTPCPWCNPADGEDWGILQNETWVSQAGELKSSFD